MCSADGRPVPCRGRRMASCGWAVRSLVAGGRQSAILRLDSSGNPDLSFGSRGLVTRPASGVDPVFRGWDGNWTDGFELQPDGRLLAIFASTSSIVTRGVARPELRIRWRGRQPLRHQRRARRAGRFRRSTTTTFFLPDICISTLATETPSASWMRMDMGRPVGWAPGGDGLHPGVSLWRPQAVLPGGDSIYVGYDGCSNELIARLHADGTPERSFGGAGTGYMRIATTAPGAALSIRFVSSIVASSDGRSLFVAGPMPTASGTCCGGNHGVARLDGATGALDALRRPRHCRAAGQLVCDRHGRAARWFLVLLGSGRAVRLLGRPAPSPGTSRSVAPLRPPSQRVS